MSERAGDRAKEKEAKGGSGIQEGTGDNRERGVKIPGKKGIQKRGSIEWKGEGTEAREVEVRVSRRRKK